MNLKTLKFISTFKTILILHNTIFFLIMMIDEYRFIGTIATNRYVCAPLYMIFNMTWIGEFFHNINNYMTELIEENNIKDLKLLYDSILNKKKFNINAVCIIYNIILFASHIWLFLLELEVKWWAILIAVTEVILISLYTIAISELVLDCVKQKKEVIKLLGDNNNEKK